MLSTLDSMHRVTSVACFANIIKYVENSKFKEKVV